MRTQEHQPEDIAPLASLVLDLSLLASSCELWLEAWDRLPDRLRQTCESIVQKKADDQQAQSRRAATVLARLQPFLKAIESSDFSPVQLPTLAATVVQLEADERQEEGSGRDGSLSADLHALQNLMLRCPTSEVTADTTRCLEAYGPRMRPPLHDGPVLEPVLQALSAADVPALRTATLALRQTVETLGILVPAMAAVTERSAVTATSWMILAVEDMPEWRSTIRNVVALLRKSLPSFFTLDYKEFENLETARVALGEAVRKARRKAKGGGPEPLLVLDLHIPRGPEHGATYDAGRELLHESRKKWDVPVIILTTPHHFLQDHLAAYHLGVADYLLKGAEPDRRLHEAICRTVTTPPTHTLAVSNDGSRMVRIDDLEFPLHPLPFAVLSSIAGGRGSPVSLNTIKDDVYYASSGDLLCVDVQDTVYNLRTAITAAFQQCGRVIRPEETVLVSASGGHAYRLVARVRDWATKKAIPPARRVLVVEDDVELWQKPVAELLRRYGYEVAVAATVQEAVAVAQEFQPQLLCLDLCLPDVPGSALDPQAGLRILRQVKAHLPDVRAVLLTSLADDDFLRGEAGQNGISPEDVLPKGEKPDLMYAALVLRLWRAELEVQRQARLPLPHLPYLPYLQLRTDGAQDTDERLVEVRVFGKRWEPTPNQRKLLLLLARRTGRSVPQAKIGASIYPGVEDVEDVEDVEMEEGKKKKKSNRLTLLVRSLRKCIATEWPLIKDLPSTQANEAAMEILVNDAKEGYMLNARIAWEGSPGLPLAD